MKNSRAWRSRAAYGISEEGLAKNPAWTMNRIKMDLVDILDVWPLAGVLRLMAEVCLEQAQGHPEGSEEKDRFLKEAHELESAAFAVQS